MNYSKKRLLESAAFGSSIAIYYACPDVIRSRTARFFVKSASFALPNAYLLNETLHILNTPIETDADHDVTDVELDNDAVATDTKMDLLRAPLPLLIGAGLLVCGSLVLSLRAERAIFRRGERRRAEGKRFAHSQFAIIAGIATGVGNYILDSIDDEN
ncbi:hypothetical protein [Arcanobacterium pinnipediorum]|uniref:HIG1 domain-containing protein n=1 Tax=Arcanobacterium pinnipediorum TaxID=1503041 RepID=A0ABY5AHA5_9ACTO|nr:hypothetical protein [Arcanobacterium pinnipediorum]USR79578.1 hypothetical protein NG665_00840 [Arcanobacterium pinnipediorum]